MKGKTIVLKSNKQIAKFLGNPNNKKFAIKKLGGIRKIRKAVKLMHMQGL